MPSLKTVIKNKAGEFVDELDKKYTDLLGEIEGKSEEAAKTAKEIIGKITKAVQAYISGELSEKEAKVAISSYRRALISRAKSLENFVKWSTYKNFWGYVAEFLKLIAMLKKQVG